MIDYDFEERLHRRLDARQAIAGLSQRERGVLAALYRHGDTRVAVAREQGVSQERIGKIHFRALERARIRLQQPKRVWPAVKPAAKPQPAFDKAAFLAHMRELHALREQERAEKAAWAANAQARAWECELRELRCQIAREAERQQAARQREAERVAHAERQRLDAAREKAEQARRIAKEAQQARHDAAWAAYDADPERQERLRLIALKAAQQELAERARRRAALWERYQVSLPELERQQREEAARARQPAFEDEVRAGIMPAWNALVARKGWSEGEAQTHWHEWLTGPPGWFG